MLEIDEIISLRAVVVFNIALEISKKAKEKVKEMFKKEYWRDGYSVGKQESEAAHNHEKYMMASRMKSMGFSQKQIAEVLNVTLEKLKEIFDMDEVHEDITEYRADK